MSVRSIPGQYKGVQFRSQLEIHWAKWLDQHRIKWAFEEESFDLGDDLCYLPDFWLPEIRTFLEVKGALDSVSCSKLARFARYCETPGITLILAESPVGLGARIVKPNAQLGASVRFSRDIMLVKCDRCEAWFWAPGSSNLKCRACGALKPKAGHIAATHPNGGHHAALGDTCVDCGALEGVLVRRSEW